jgi:hypothetical protein
MRKALLFLLPVVVASFAFGSSRAEAKKSGGVVVYQYGDNVFEAGPLPKPYGDIKELSGYQAGYKCKVFGLFWATFHKWNCEPVAFLGKTFLDADKAPSKELRDQVLTLNKAIGKKYKLSDVKMGFWAKHGRIFIVLGILGLIGWGVYSQFGGKKKKKDKKEKKDQPAETA